MPFAKGKQSLAISDRSGQAFPYTEMVREWNGSFVHISEYEAKHPQLDPKVYGADPQGLINARPQYFPPNQIGGGNMVVTAYPDHGQSDLAFTSNGMRPNSYTKPAMAMYLAHVTVITEVNADVTGISLTTNIENVIIPDENVDITGISLNTNIENVTVIADANVDIAGISLTTNIESVTVGIS